MRESCGHTLVLESVSPVDLSLVCLKKQSRFWSTTSENMLCFDMEITISCNVVPDLESTFRIYGMVADVCGICL
jgi:hypothetical protein